ncbi:RNA-binding protein Ro60-like [Tachypleus tridentatus]|uniref:RNA-binding protein Ro60-like n=1 Tax=Tachypleus tridentatus TaxID=6853 RepID=UPI003FD33244
MTSVHTEPLSHKSSTLGDIKGIVSVDWTMGDRAGISEHSRLLRFLHIGTEANCYTPGNKKFSVENVHCIDTSNQELAVKEIVRVAKEGLSVCPDALFFALAVCSRSQDPKTKDSAYSALQEVCLTGEGLFSFVHFGKRSANPPQGGEEVVELPCNWYKLNLCLVFSALSAIYKYITHGYEAAEKEFSVEDVSSDVKEILAYLKAVHELKHTTDEQKAVHLIEMHDLSFEHVPTQLLKSEEVWLCLISRLPVQVLVAQLPRLHRLGFLKQKSPVLKPLLERLNTEITLTVNKLNPLQTFIIIRHLEILQKGPADKTVFHIHKYFQLNNTLQMLQRSSFKMVRPTNKRYLMAVDICGSMFHGRKTSGCRYLSSADASCLVLMALAQAESEKLTALAFSKDGLEEIEVSKEMSHGEVLKKLREIPMGTVDQASPLLWAKEKKKSFDVILICTDNQTQPDTHPVDAFKDYRKTMDLPQAR